MKTPKELYAKFPYQFDGPNIGIGVSRGWFPLLAKLCSDIDALLGEDKHGFHWSQVKEKFGAGRFYWDLGRTKGPLHLDIQTPKGLISFATDPSKKQHDPEKAALMESINGLVRAAQKATQQLCAVCGEPGTLDPGDGYYLTLCPSHIAGRKNDPHSEILQKNLWFEPDENFPGKAWQ